MSNINQYGRLASGDVLSFTIEGEDHYINADTDVSQLCQYINLNYTSPSFRIYVLFPDETINYEIPNNVIKLGGNYSENYQDGQRRSLSFTIYNEDGKYSPDINNLWAGTRLRLDVGITKGSVTVWFHKGIFIINKITPSLSPNSREVSITAGDKFGLFENTTGRLETSYNIDAGLDIEEIIKTIQKTSLGDDTVFDTKPLIYHHLFKGKKTQVAISKSAGDNYGSILTELATQLSAEIFYNSEGNLTLIPITDASQDINKPIVYQFNADNGDFTQLSFDYDYNSIVNRVVVIGNSNNGVVNEATAINNDERSPFCYQRIGYRTGTVINDTNINTENLAKERAEYELRQQLILKTSSSTEIIFNPFLSVNNLIAVDSDFYSLSRTKYLLQNVSFSLDYSNKMNISFTNIINITTDIGSIKIITPSSKVGFDKYISVVPGQRQYYNISIGNLGQGIIGAYLGSYTTTKPDDPDAIMFETGIQRKVPEGGTYYLHAITNATYYQVPTSGGSSRALTNWSDWTKIGERDVPDGSGGTMRQYFYYIKMPGRVYSLPDGGIYIYGYNQFDSNIELGDLPALSLPDITFKVILDDKTTIASVSYDSGSITPDTSPADVKLQSSKSHTFVGHPAAYYYVTGLGEKIDSYVVTPNLLMSDEAKTIHWGSAKRKTGTVKVPVDWSTFDSITVKYHGVTSSGQYDDNITTSTITDKTKDTVVISGVAQNSTYTVSGSKANVSYKDVGDIDDTITSEETTFSGGKYMKDSKFTAPDCDTREIRIQTGVGVSNCHLTYYAAHGTNRGQKVSVDTGIINSTTTKYSDDDGPYKIYEAIAGVEDCGYSFEFTAEAGYSIKDNKDGEATTISKDEYPIWIGYETTTYGWHNRGSRTGSITSTESKTGWAIWSKYHWAEATGTLDNTAQALTQVTGSVSFKAGIDFNEPILKLNKENLSNIAKIHKMTQGSGSFRYDAHCEVDVSNNKIIIRGNETDGGSPSGDDVGTYSHVYSTLPSKITSDSYPDVVLTYNFSSVYQQFTNYEPRS